MLGSFATPQMNAAWFLIVSLLNLGATGKLLRLFGPLTDGAVVPLTHARADRGSRLRPLGPAVSEPPGVELFSRSDSIYQV